MRDLIDHSFAEGYRSGGGGHARAAHFLSNCRD
jgi:hypothetical protein